MFDSDDTTTILNFDYDEDETLILNEEQRLKYFNEYEKPYKKLQYEPGSGTAPEAKLIQVRNKASVGA